MTQKLELHLHLEGAAPPALIRDIAREKGADISGVFAEDGGYVLKDFNHFLKVYEAATSVLTSPEDYARLTRAVLSECASHGVIYAETFVSPDFCGGGDLIAWRDYLAAIEQAAREAEAEEGIELRAIVTCVRHFGPEKARAAALCAAEEAGNFLTGFGMGGDEMMGEQGDYAWAFDCAREAGLRLTTHAGEWGGPASVRQAIHDLGVERLGHGVQIIEDPALVEEIIEKGITLEVCPGSNVALGVTRDWQSHPIEKLREKGVKVTVSTDDPPFFCTDMSREYQRLADTFGWDDEIFAEINQTALGAAFCDDATKQRLAKRLESPSHG